MNRGADRGKRNEMPIRSENAVQSLIVVMLVAGIAVSTLCIGLLSGVPPVSRDALTHHLYVPNLYVAAGKIVELPHIPFSYYPMNLDLLYAVPLLFGNDILPKYIHFLFALLTCWWIHRFTAKRYGRIYGLFGALFFLSVPIVIKLSTTVYVDLGLVFFTTASLLGLARWREGGFPARTLICAGLFCGLAMGTKYNGLVSFALLTLMVPVLYLKGNPGAPCLQWKALWQGMVFGAVALVAFSPWMLRNIVWTGNPFYPLYQNVFAPRPVGDSISDPEPEDGESGPPPKEAVRWTPFNIRSIVYGESKWRIASIPIRVFFEGKDDDPRHFDGVLSPFLLLFPLGLLLKPSGGRPMAPGMSGMFFLFSSWWYFSSRT
jgi:4-amino-4-deoxy-L-arabinose transferase-like glycosyltransferase